MGIICFDLTKQTHRAKDYAVIGELARLLPPEREVELTTDADRLLQLAPRHRVSKRPAVAAAARGDRDATIVALARETDALPSRIWRRSVGSA